MTKAVLENHRVTLVVRRKWQEADDLWRFDLADPDDWALPPFEAGAHIDLHVPGGALRQYSLCSDPHQTRLWSIAVRREADGRGGSRALCDDVAEGDRLLSSLPRNAFALANAPTHLMIAGGVGITPFLSMLPEIARRGQRARLIYLTRSPAATGFLPLLHTVAPELDLCVHHTLGDSTARFDLPALLASVAPEDAVYACGPRTLLETVRGAGDGLGDRLRIEWFGPAPGGANTAYTIRLAETGERIPVRAGQSMLDALRQNGHDRPSSCEAGLCLDCRVRHLAGDIDHRDILLGAEARRTHLTPCVSGCTSDEVVLSLATDPD